MTTEPFDDIVRRTLHRTIALLGAEPIDALRSKTVAIGGCGGVGGAACLTLARMGVGGFILADPGEFDEPDINRQWGASRDTLGRNKADVYAEALKAINPGLRIRIHTEGVQDDNVAEFVAGADLLIDCLDMRVPMERRVRMFDAARARGVYSITAPVLGFGCAVLVAAPDGMPMVAVGGMIDRASSDSALPELLRDLYVPEHLAATERLMPEHRVPSVAPGPSLASALVCTESLLILAGATIPGWRPPLCLPRLLAVDMVRMSYRVVDLAAFLERMAFPGDRSRPADAPPPQTSVASSDGLANVLEQVGWNTNLLPHEVVAVDLLTDSWSELSAKPPLPAEPGDASAALARCEQAIQGLYGYRQVMPVFRGRFAEAILAKAIVRPGAAVACNALFPSTRFHLESSGAELVDVGVESASDLGDAHPLKGNVDLERLGGALGEGKIQAVYVELAVNATGGHPVSLANLRALREATAAARIPLVLDATRAFENAALLRERDAGLAGRSLTGLVREMCDCSDACATSLTKDFQAPMGAFIGANQPELFSRLCDLRLAFGDGLDGEGRSRLCRALRVDPEQAGAGALARVRQVRRLWEALREMGVPVVEPVGGHAVFVDAAALLPHVAAGQFAAVAACNAVFVLSGVRGGVSFLSAHHERAQAQIVRFAVPVGRHGDAELDRLVTGFRRLMDARASVSGLMRVGGPAGAVGRFVATYRPLGRPRY